MKLIYILIPLAVILPLVFGYGANFLLDESELEPATFDLLAESRDTTRTSDIATLSSAVGLYLATTNEKLICDPLKIYRSDIGGRQIDGTGWVPVNFNLIPGGSPLALLPIDPINGSEFHYIYVCNPGSNLYEFNSSFESERMSEYAANDGGSNISAIEYGNNLFLIQ